MAIHKPRGGSTAKRTIACPGWHKRSEGMPKSPESFVAKKGTVLHEILLEKYYRDPNYDPYSEVGCVVEGVEITEELIDAKITPAIEAIEDILDVYDCNDYYTELYAEIDEDTGGTVDFLAKSGDGKTLIALDYKSGDGIIIGAEDNAQCLFYILCLYLDSQERFHAFFDGVETLAVVIVQPTHRLEEIIDIWETDLATLFDFRETYAKAVELSVQAEPPLASGDHCHYCPAKPFCPEFTKHQLTAEKTPQDALSNLPDDELASALNAAQHLVEWAKAVQAHAYETLEAGGRIAGYKLVPKRATRQWRDEAKAEHILRQRFDDEDLYEWKLKSPAKIEKLCKQQHINYAALISAQVKAVSSGTTLTRADDPRLAASRGKAAQLLAERFSA